MNQYGERGWIRTSDPRLKRALLYQLSYAPTRFSSYHLADVVEVAQADAPCDAASDWGGNGDGDSVQAVDYGKVSLYDWELMQCDLGANAHRLSQRRSRQRGNFASTGQPEGRNFGAKSDKKPMR